MIEYALLSGLTGFVFIDLLCQPYEVFGWWEYGIRRMLLGAYDVCYEKVVPVFDPDSAEWWQIALYKPLAGCAKCFAGWFSVVIFLATYNFQILPFIFFVVGAIATAWALTNIKEKYLNQA